MVGECVARTCVPTQEMGLPVHGKSEISILPYGDFWLRRRKTTYSLKNGPTKPSNSTCLLNKHPQFPRHPPPHQCPTDVCSPGEVKPSLELMDVQRLPPNDYGCPRAAPRPAQELMSSRGHPPWAGPLDDADSKGARSRRASGWHGIRAPALKAG